MARGGRRAGAGAPKGAANGAAKKAAISRAISTGEAVKTPRAKTVKQSPLEQILAAMALVPPPFKPVTGIMAEPEMSAEEHDPNMTPKEFLLKIMRNPLERPDRRDKAAALLLPFEHAKAGEDGKKQQQQHKATTAASGKFSTPSAPPKLTVAK